MNNCHWIEFTLSGNSYCVSGEYVKSMFVPNNISFKKSNGSYLSDTLNYNNKVYYIIDLRSIFNMPTLEDDFKSFESMKNKHIQWLEELKRCVLNDLEFLLSRNPHKCEFGKWYYNYNTDNLRLNYILKKIESPHNKLHYCALEIDKYKEENVSREKIIEKLGEAEYICKNELLPLLDSLIKEYRDINKGIIIILNLKGRDIGIYVDEVKSLMLYDENKYIINNENVKEYLENDSFINNVIISEEKIIFQVDIDKILNIK